MNDRFVGKANVEIANNKDSNMHGVVFCQVLKKFNPSGDDFDMGRGQPEVMKVNVVKMFVIINNVSF